MNVLPHCKTEMSIYYLGRSTYTWIVSAMRLWFSRSAPSLPSWHVTCTHPVNHICPTDFTIWKTQRPGSFLSQDKLTPVLLQWATLVSIFRWFSTSRKPCATFGSFQKVIKVAISCLCMYHLLHTDWKLIRWESKSVPLFPIEDTAFLTVQN